MERDTAELKNKILELRAEHEALHHSDFRRGMVFEEVDFAEGELQRMDMAAWRKLRAELGHVL